MTASQGLSLRASYEACERLARSHYENFPVASRLLPRHLRPHVAAIYAFARTADDIADEPGRDVADRLTWLSNYREMALALPAAPPRDEPAWFFVPALADTVRRFELPVSLLTDLLSAFEQDVTTTRYATWEEVLDYCRRSANPVGRLVLRLNGYAGDDLERASDAVCTALQLTNFWQDLAVDWSRGRLYVPAEEYERHGAELHDLDAVQWTPAWRATLAACGHRTAALFDDGRPVCDGVSGRLRYELRATWLGGTRVLARLDHAGFDVFRARPSLGIADALVIGCRALAWRPAP